MTARLCARRLKRGLVDGVAWKVKHPCYPLEPWQKAPQRLAQRALSRRARFRYDEALVWNGPRPLSGTRPQRLSSAVRRHGDEHETGARACVRPLTRSQERRPESPGKRTIAGQTAKRSPTHPSKPVIAASTHRSQQRTPFCKALRCGNPLSGTLIARADSSKTLRITRLPPTTRKKGKVGLEVTISWAGFDPLHTFIATDRMSPIDELR